MHNYLIQLESRSILLVLIQNSCFLFNILFVFVCLFVQSLSSNPRIFLIITGEGLLILIYARHSRQLISAGSLACHTSCDTGHPFIMVISEDPRHLRLFAERSVVELSLPVFATWVCHGRDSNTQPSACGANVLTH